MNIKYYKSSSNICINIVLADKSNKHVVFSPTSDGTSVYSTSDKQEQKAIERHHNFGKLFYLDSEQSEEELNSPPAESAIEYTHVQVTDLASAKAYLAETFGLSRTRLNSRDRIIAAATANHIIFEGLD